MYINYSDEVIFSAYFSTRLNFSLKIRAFVVKNEKTKQK